MTYNTQYIHFEALSNFVLKEFHLKHFGLYIAVSRNDSSFLASLYNNSFSFFLSFLNSPFVFPQVIFPSDFVSVSGGIIVQLTTRG